MAWHSTGIELNDTSATALFVEGNPADAGFFASLVGTPGNPITAVLANNSEIDIYVGGESVTTTTGALIAAGDEMILDGLTGNPIDVLYAISASATPTLGVSLNRQPYTA